MNPVIYFRPALMEPEEFAAASRHFSMVGVRGAFDTNDLIIGRYSTLPYYAEFIADVAYANADAINPLAHHLYVADLGAHVPDLGNLAPPTWNSLPDVPKDAGPFVLKGETNSLKNLWTTHMYAETWNDAVEVYRRLTQDSLIGTQHIYIRKYVPLEILWTNLSGLPITVEFRFFVYKGRVISSGFYWDVYKEDLLEHGHNTPDPGCVPWEVMNEVLTRIGDRVNFYAVDLALDVNGRWWVVDLNDGQQAGLCGNDPNVLYGNLAAALLAEK